MDHPRDPASSPCQAPPGYWDASGTPPQPSPPPRCCGPAFLKRSLLFAWSVWFTIVFSSNVADAAKTLGLLPPTWAFASGNFHFLEETTSRYALPTAANAALFAAVITWEGLAALLFWRATWLFPTPSRRSSLYAAFMSALLLWSAFMLADETFIAYTVEGTHLRLFIAQLATLLAIELLPES